MITPDPDKIEQMNTEVNGKLTSAFRYLISDVLQRPDAAKIVSCAPPVHALQFLMREAAARNDVADIQSLYDTHGHILYKTDDTTACQIMPLASPKMGVSDTAMYRAAFQDDVGLTTQLETPSAALITHFNALFSQIQHTMQQHLPLWSRELESLVRTIVLATAQENKFGGASAFAGWGSVLVNPASCHSVLGTALTIVHESSHVKLFYPYLDDEIVLNDPDDRYASPLRREARPMNGIYHAAFVLARMVLFLQDVKDIDTEHCVFGGVSMQDVHQEQAQLITAFDAAYDVIASQGVLTPLGQKIIHEAADVVARCAQP